MAAASEGPTLPGTPSSPGSFKPTMNRLSAPRADGRHQLRHEPGAAAHVAAVLIGAHVRMRGEELVEHVAMGCGDLDPAEAAALQARARGGELVDQALDLADANGPRHRPAEIVRQHGSADGVGIAPGYIAPAAPLQDLPNEPAIVRFHRFNPALQPRVAVVVPGAHAVRKVLVTRHAQRLGHDQRRTAARPVGVITDKAFAHAGVLAICVDIEAWMSRLRSRLPAST